MKNLILFSLLLVVLLPLKTLALDFNLKDKAPGKDSVIKKRVFKRFKINWAGGVLFPGNSDFQTGFPVAIEPKFAIIDPLEIGLRFEGAFSYLINENAGSGKLRLIGSSLITLDYYFTNGGFRPFIGAGVGPYRIFNASADSVTIGNLINNGAPNVQKSNESAFGEMVRAGFEYHHLRIAAEYNILPKSVYGGSNSYFDVKLGFNIGGGRKRY